MIALD